MESPSPELMHAYGTDEFYVDNLEKRAALPILARMAAGAGFLGLVAHQRRHEERLRTQAAILNEMFRQEEAERMAATIQSFQHPGDRMMAGIYPLDQGMERLASVAAHIGRGMAHQELEKEAGIGGAALSALGKGLSRAKGAVGSATKIGWKGKLLGLGALGGVGYLGYKGLQAGKDYMMQPTSGGRWGTGQQLRTRVNQWGQPTY